MAGISITSLDEPRKDAHALRALGVVSVGAHEEVSAGNLPSRPAARQAIGRHD
jgi:hypothetical protein